MANFDRAIKKIIYILFLFRMETLYMESNNAFSEEKEIKETEFLILLAWFFCVTIKLRENKCFSLSPLVLTRKNTLFIVKKPSHARMLSICQSSCFLYRCYYPLTLTKFPRLQCTDPRMFFSRSTLVFQKHSFH